MSVSDDEIDCETVASVSFSPIVQQAIDQLLPSKDPLDQPDLNITEYINSIFPTEQSLNNIDDVIANLETKILSIEDEMRTVIRDGTNMTQNGEMTLEEAKKMIKQLLTHVNRIRKQAEASEESVREITQDIKQLDTAKKNLTSVITTLNHLHMLLAGVEALQTLSSNRQYGEILLPLQGVTQVMEHFEGYRDIPHIAELHDQVQQLRVTLAQQITADFHNAFSGSKQVQQMPLARLADAAKVVSILDPQVRKELLTWFEGLQLAEYMQLFQENQDCAWLDKIEKRYSWFKRHLLDMEEKFGSVFPPEWELSERLAVQFCKVTRSELSKIMSKRTHEIDVKLLLFVIQKTEGFENLLAKRFTGITLKPDVVTKVNSSNPFEFETENKTNETDDECNQHPFRGLIGQCFEPHLPIYVESLDRNLSDLMERFTVDAKQQLTSLDGVGVEATVLPSCADLFVFYKKCLVQCSQLSTSHTMLALSHTFQKYLREYAIKVLQGNLPKIGGSGGTRTELAAGFIQTFLREGDSSRLDGRELRRVSTILITAEYCADTVAQLEEKLKEKITETLRSQVSLAEEQDLFNAVIAACLQLLVQDLDAACDASLTAMTKMNWGGVESVGDQSGYVTSIVGHMKSTVPTVRDQLSSSRKYFTKYCSKFASVFMSKFISNLYKCRGVSTVGAEQLLLDTHSLKTILIDMPSISSQIQRKPPPSYVKAVSKGMGKAEMILKAVMSSVEPEKAFVEQVFRLLPDIDKSEFQKILEMKGLKRSEQQTLLELRREMIVAGALHPEPEPTDYDVSRVKKLEQLITAK